MAKSEPELRFSDFICISLSLTRLSLKVCYVSGDVLGVQGAKMGDCCHWPWVSSFVGNWVCGKTIRLHYDICNNGIVHKLPCRPRNLVTWPWLNCPDRSLQLDQKQPSSDLPGTLGSPWYSHSAWEWTQLTHPTDDLSLTVLTVRNPKNYSTRVKLRRNRSGGDRWTGQKQKQGVQREEPNSESGIVIGGRSRRSLLPRQVCFYH